MNQKIVKTTKIAVILYIVGIIYVNLVVENPNSVILNKLSTPVAILVVILFILLDYLLAMMLYTRLVKRKPIWPVFLEKSEFQSKYFQWFYTLIILFSFIILNYVLITAVWVAVTMQ